MVFKVIGTGSSGNGYVLQSQTGQSLVLEAGVPVNDIVKTVNYDVTNIMSVLITHSHSDHSKYVGDMLERGWTVLAPFENKKGNFNTKIPETGKWFQVGDFRVMPLEVKHDVDIFAYVIKHSECGVILFATDTKYLPFQLSRVDYMIIEANYDPVILQKNVNNGLVNSELAKRIINGHFSIDYVIDTIKKYDLTIKGVILIHLSSRNANPTKFKERVNNETGILTTVARKGVEITLW